MVAKHLGTTIDIHGGGNDLIFPHHDNEIAQSTCAHDGELFSRFWLHNGFVNVDHTKMSKSLGNILLVRELLEQVPGEAVRLALLNAHYRQPLDWSDSVLLEAKRKLDRLYGTLRDISGWETQWKDARPNSVFLTALEDDLNTPRALAALFDLTREANRSVTDTERTALAAELRSSAEMLGLLGNDPEEWFTLDANAELTGPQIEERLAERNAARKNRDFAAADRIRDELAGVGISIEDGPDGTRWRRE